MEIRTNPRYKDFKIIFECTAGSHMYGTNTEHSDIDIRGVFIPTKEYFLGFANKIEQIEEKSRDIVHYDIRKFFDLCLKCNPSMIELLFVHYGYKTFEYSEIQKNRALFLSKKARYTFSGYAISQLHRIKRHRSWLLNPPKKQPLRSDFGLPMNKTLVTKDQLNALEELNNEYDYDLVEDLQLDINTLDILQREKAFINANKNWKQYENWKKNRNPVRAEMEKKFGFDLKHSAHLYRLITEGKELLTAGYITLPRPDVDELRKIREGHYSYDELMFMIGDIDEVFDKLYEKSSLPHSPDIKKADRLCIDLVEQNIFNKG